MTDYSSIFSKNGPSFNPSSFGGGYNSTFSSSGPTFNPGSFTGGYDFSPSASYEVSGAKKPGFNWKTFLVGLGQASPAIERAILRLRGFPESEMPYAGDSFRMAGSLFSDLLKGQEGQGSDSLAKMLREASGSMGQDFSDFDPKKSLSIL